MACGSVEREGVEPPPGACDANPNPTPVASATRESSILADDDYARDFTADAYGVYWFGPGGNLRMLAHGTAEPKTLFEQANGVTIAVDADAIYFHGSGAISLPTPLLRLERGAAEPQVLRSMASETPYGMWGPVLDAERVYFMNDSGHVASVPKLGGEPVDTVIDYRRLRGFTVDDTHLYWVESSNDVSSLKRVPKAGGEPQVLAAGFKDSIPSFRGSALPQVIGNSVLFVAEHALFAVPKTGGCARTLIWDTSHYIVAFLVDGDQIYVKRVLDSDTGASSILRVRFTDGEAVELTDYGAQSAARGLGFFANRLYWASDLTVYVLEL